MGRMNEINKHDSEIQKILPTGALDDLNKIAEQLSSKNEQKKIDDSPRETRSMKKSATMEKASSKAKKKQIKPRIDTGSGRSDKRYARESRTDKYNRELKAKKDENEEKTDIPEKLSKTENIIEKRIMKKYNKREVSLEKKTIR